MTKSFAAEYGLHARETNTIVGITENPHRCGVRELDWRGSVGVFCGDTGSHDASIPVSGAGAVGLEYMVRSDTEESRQDSSGGLRLAGLRFDLNDRSMYLASPFPPLHAQRVATNLESGASQQAGGNEHEVAAQQPAGAQLVRSPDVAQVEDGGGENSPTPPSAKASTPAPATARSLRMAQALAEVKSAAQLRGLLKAAPDAPSSELFVDEAGTGELATSVAADSAGGRMAALVALAGWLRTAVGMAEFFLIDERGYSLLPDSTDDDNGVADEVQPAAVLLDLGLRLGGVLEIAGRRMATNPSRGPAGSRVARLALEDGRWLAVARVTGAGAERPLLGWVEAADAPLADDWVASACGRVAEVLGEE